MQRAPVRVAVDGDRFETQVTAGPDDPDRDLAAIGDKDPSEREGVARPAGHEWRHGERPSLHKDTLASRQRVETSRPFNRGVPAGYRRR
jgi:hypothetical protein